LRELTNAKEGINEQSTFPFNGDRYIATATLFKVLVGSWRDNTLESSPSTKPAQQNSEKIAS
jgi:hypothetical protein